MTTSYEVCRAQIKERVMAFLQMEEALEDDVVYSRIEEIAEGFACYRLLRPQDKERLLKEVFNSINIYITGDTDHYTYRLFFFFFLLTSDLNQFYCLKI